MKPLKMQPGGGGLVKPKPALRSKAFQSVNLARLETAGEMAEPDTATDIARNDNDTGKLVGNSDAVVLPPNIDWLAYLYDGKIVEL